MTLAKIEYIILNRFKRQPQRSGQLAIVGGQKFQETFKEDFFLTHLFKLHFICNYDFLFGCLQQQITHIFFN
jgi:hypothetical protein